MASRCWLFSVCPLFAWKDCLSVWLSSGPFGSEMPCEEKQPEQLQDAPREVTTCPYLKAKQAAFDQASAAWAAANANAQKAAAELAAVQKEIADAPAKVKAANDALRGERLTPELIASGSA